MKYELKVTSEFRKSYKLMKKRGADIHSREEVISALRKGKIPAPKYNDHQLKGKYSKFWEGHVGAT